MTTNNPIMEPFADSGNTERNIAMLLDSVAYDVFPELYTPADHAASTQCEESEDSGGRFAFEISILPEPTHVADESDRILLECDPLCSTGILASFSPFQPLSASHEYQTAFPSALRFSDSFEVYEARKDFPILSESVNGKPLVWLDNAATTQKPMAVIDRIRYFYEHENSNVHRGAHTLATRTTDAFEAARKKAARFINADSADEIVFVRGTTEAVNLVAHSYGMQVLKEGDEVILSVLEHHANIVPWQLLCERTGATLRIIPTDSGGQIDLESYGKLLSEKAKIVAFTHVSNVIGTITPAAEMVKMAHRYGAKALIDGAQAVAHIPVDVLALDCDFYAFSGHKLYGPTGIGVLYGKPKLLALMPPYQGGGNMIRDVRFEATTYQAPPHRFEAGTANIADAIGLGAAIDYITNFGMETLFRHEHALWEYGWEILSGIPGVKLYGDHKDKIGVLSFTCDGLSSQEIGEALDKQGIAIRAGHHCAQPILRHLGLSGTARASFALYNTKEEIDVLGEQLYRLCGRPKSDLW